MVEVWTSALRFLITGGLATIVHVGLFSALLRFTALSPPVATVISFLCALTLSYRLHHSWTFKVQGQHRKFFFRFVLIACTGSALNYTIMSLATGTLGWHPLAGLALVVAVVAPGSFAANRWWGFR